MRIFKGFIIIASIISLLFPTSVKAEEWMQIDYKVFLETSSIKSKDDLRSYWIKIIEGRPGATFVQNELLDCSTGKINVLIIELYYSATNEFIKEFEPENYTLRSYKSSSRDAISKIICQ